MELTEEVHAFLKVWLIVLACLCYCYFIVSKITIPIFKFFSLLPIFTLFTILPLSLSSVLPAGLTAYFITWLANFKLLLFAFNHGPLSNPRLTLFKFLLISVFPVKIEDPYSPIKKPTKELALNFWLKALIFSVLVAVCDSYKGGKLKLHPFLGFMIYCCILYLFIDMVMGICNTFVGSIVGGVELLPPSDKPYLSSSLQDFWGKRWNLVVTDTLRHTVYNPTRAILSKCFGERWAPVPAVMVVFVVSGLMHELIFYSVARRSPTWEVTLFFVFHGVCVIIEVYLKNNLGQKLGLPWIVTGPLAVGFVMGTGCLWFFPPLVRNGLDVRAIEEVMTLYDFVKGSLSIKIMT